jgi:hypothetical protein
MSAKHTSASLAESVMTVRIVATTEERHGAQ